MLPMGLSVEVTCHLWWPFEARIRFAVLFLTDQQTPGGHSVKLSWPEMWYIPCLCNFTKAGVAAYQNINYSSDSQKIQTASAREDPNPKMDQGTKQTNADEHPHMHTELSLQPTLPSFTFQWGNTFLKGSRVNKHTLQEKMRNLNSHIKIRFQEKETAVTSNNVHFLIPDRRKITEKN